MNPVPAPYPRRLLLHVLMGFTLYWIGNILVVFPWMLSKTLGIVAMFLSVLLWGYMSFFCLRHSPKNEWNKDTLSMAICFLVTAMIQDYLLYVVYRGIPDELYEVTTFLAYGMVFLIPFIIRYIVLWKRNYQTIRSVSNLKLIVTASIGIISLILTLWSVKFW